MIVLLYLQVLGAAWYLLSIDRYTSCWKKFCKEEFNSTRCQLNYLDCDAHRKTWETATNVFKKCNPKNDIEFKYGIFENAVTKDVVFINFIKRYFYCLWWGLQNLRYGFFY